MLCRRSQLRIDVLSTTLTEERNFSIQLVGPTGDVVLSEPATATVLVFTSPGVVGWLPTNQTSPIDGGAGQKLRLLRAVGVYGVVTVRWSLLDSAGGAVIGVSPTSGVEVFPDGVDSVDVLLSPVADGRPSPVQVGVARLTSPTGGARLPDASDRQLLLEKIVVVADTGSAYGIVELSNSSIVVVSIGPTNALISRASSSFLPPTMLAPRGIYGDGPVVSVCHKSEL